MPLYPTTPFPRSLLEACVASVPFYERISILIDISIQQMIWILARRPSESSAALVADYLVFYIYLSPSSSLTCYLEVD